LATDVFTLTGAPGRIITPVLFGISGVATAAGAFSVKAVKRSTANTGGTSTTPTPVAGISTNPGVGPTPPAKGVVRAYTANPTLGTLVGDMMSKRDSFTTASGAIPETETLFDFRGDYRGEVQLLSGDEVLALNLAGVTVMGGLLDAWVAWTEEYGL
jgi:hypothetical protein